jgi:hypothetical protein
VGDDGNFMPEIAYLVAIDPEACVVSADGGMLTWLSTAANCCDGQYD